MLRLPLTLLSTLVLGLTTSALSAQCEQPAGSAATVIASPCPESNCMTMTGDAKVGSSLTFDTVSRPNNIFVIGLPASDPISIAPGIMICDDEVTIPQLYVGEICIAEVLPCGTYSIDIPDMPELAGITMIAQHLYLRDSSPTGTSSVVLEFTIAAASN